LKASVKQVGSSCLGKFFFIIRRSGTGKVTIFAIERKILPPNPLSELITNFNFGMIAAILVSFFNNENDESYFAAKSSS
jgi:hypothetical protein